MITDVTGIRVGLAAARGIALATGARLMGVTGFQAVASGLAGHSPPAKFILVALESRRDDLYLQLFDHAFVALMGPMAASPKFSSLTKGLTSAKLLSGRSSRS